MSTNIVEFKNEGDFQASHAACDWLRKRGFSVGSMKGDEPRAIWHGDCYISKWRGLNPWEKREMHARMEGDARNGPVRIILLPAATDAARAAFALTDAQAEPAPPKVDPDNTIDGDAAVFAENGL
jgi:hypothetical protein